VKTILLQFKNSRSETKPRRHAVEIEHENGNLSVTYTYKYSDGSSSVTRQTLTKQADGSYRNENGCEYVAVKADRRPKPYSVTYRSGIGEGSTTTKFATISEVRAYVKGRWNGVEYIDSPTCFHNDFGHFFLKNCSLSELGQRLSNDPASDLYWSWTWHAEAA
jgi:hypothetical protein